MKILWSEIIKKCRQGKWSVSPDKIEEKLGECLACDFAVTMVKGRESMCNYCAIRDYTGKHTCSGTPYEDLSNYLERCFYKNEESDIEIIKKYMQEERELLKKVEFYCLRREQEEAKS